MQHNVQMSPEKFPFTVHYSSNMDTIQYYVIHINIKLFIIFAKYIKGNCSGAFCHFHMYYVAIYFLSFYMSFYTNLSNSKRGKRKLCLTSRMAD